MSIIKEYYQNQIDMRGPGNPKAQPAVTGTVSILRHDDGKPLTMQRASTLFNEAAKDFPQADPAKVRIVDDHIEVAAKPPADYTQLPAHTVGARGVEMTILITPDDFGKFKIYARKLLNDFTQAHVGPYIHNEALQEIMVTWGERARKGITEIYPKPENITALDKPYVSPIEAGAYDVKSLVKRFMEHAGFRETPEFTSIAGMKKNRFDIKITDDYDDDFLSSVDSLAIRVNGDLGAALKTLREIDDATLDTICRKALKKTNIVIQPPIPG